MLPEAQRAAQLLGAGPNAVPVILAQWAHESGFEADNWIGEFNYSGITSGGEGNWRTFGSTEEHTRAYVGALTDPKYRYTYGFFLDAARENQPPSVLARLLGASDWSADHYNLDGTGPGSALVDVIYRYELNRLSDTRLPPGAIGGRYPYIPGTTVDPGLPSTPPEQGTERPTPQYGGRYPYIPGTTVTVPEPAPTAADGLLDRIKNTLFSADWWKRAGLLLAMVIVGLLFVAAAIWGMTKAAPAPAPASGEGEA